MKKLIIRGCNRLAQGKKAQGWELNRFSDFKVPVSKISSRLESRRSSRTRQDRGGQKLEGSMILEGLSCSCHDARI